MASRGGAAFLVGGTTIHARLGTLPHGGAIWKDSEEMRLCLLRAHRGELGGTQGDERWEFRNDFWSKLDVLFIDEVFLVSNSLLSMVEATARAIRGNNEPYGGIRLVFMGDPCQLPPRGDAESFPFSAIVLKPPTPTNSGTDSDGSDDEWSVPRIKDLFKIVLRPWEDAMLMPMTLKENMRQAGDSQQVGDMKGT